MFIRFAEAVRFASQDEAIGKGTTYDLCYCNMNSEGFDINRHFAFLRDFEDHTVLVAANFSDKETVMKLMIPQHAFEWMGLPVSEAFRPGSVVEVAVQPHDAKLISLI